MTKVKVQYLPVFIYFVASYMVLFYITCVIWYNNMK